MDEPKSYFERVVCLRSWWLDKSEKGFDGKQLVVAGFSNREKEARRVFISAPILKRHDDYNLETVDGISVKLHGFIDKARTEANGFSSQICHHFLFGFPAWWEECAKKCFNKEYTTELLTRNNTGIEAASPRKGIIGHETADEVIVPRCVDSSNADKDLCQSGETVRLSHSSVSTVEKHDAKQGEDTTTRKKIIQNDSESAAKSKRATLNENLSRREAGKKLAHVNETVHIVSPEAAPSRISRSEHETANKDIVPGCLISSNADDDQYLSGETVVRNHSSDSNTERQDAKQAETTGRPKRQKGKKKFAQASRNSRSVKIDLTSAGKRKRRRSATSLSGREPEKKSTDVNESTPVHDRVPILSPEAASFRRSRSGRLLLPPLEYWHNQRAVYDVNRKIIGVEGILDH